MTVIDYKRELKGLYQAASDPTLVDVPALTYLMIDGHGDPNVSAAYAEAVQALYSISYAAKFLLKRGPAALNYTVMPLEGLWWSADMTAFTEGSKDSWDWTMMILQPGAVTAEVLQEANAKAAAKGLTAAVSRARLERYEEGRSAQVMHIGPYAAEAPTIRRLHAFIAENGLQLRGKHHEIYLGDPRRADPQKLRTIIRQPVA